MVLRSGIWLLLILLISGTHNGAEAGNPVRKYRRAHCKGSVPIVLHMGLVGCFSKDVRKVRTVLGKTGWVILRVNKIKDDHEKTDSAYSSMIDHLKRRKGYKEMLSITTGSEDIQILLKKRRIRKDKVLLLIQNEEQFITLKTRMRFKALSS